MALFFPEGIEGEYIYLPIMTYEIMDLKVQPYIRNIVYSLYICDKKYSVWLYNKYTKKSEFIEGDLCIPLTEDTRVVSFSLNNIDYYMFCVTDKELKEKIQKMLSFVYQKDGLVYHEKD